VSFYHRPKVEALAESEFEVIPEPARPKNSKPFLSYLTGLVAMSPYLVYLCYTYNPRATGFAEEVAAAMFDKLNAFKNSEHIAYMKDKLGEWHSKAANGASPAAREGNQGERGLPDLSTVAATGDSTDWLAMD
jgi:hypothetical protein